MKRFTHTVRTDTNVWTFDVTVELDSITITRVYGDVTNRAELNKAVVQAFREVENVPANRAILGW